MKFSIVITTKDRFFYLKRVINAVLESTMTPSEIVVVNDGGELIDKNSFNCGHNISLIIINNQFSRGANYCRNLAIQSTSNDLVFLLDDDDSITRESLEKRIVTAKNNPKAGIIFTGIKIVSSNNLNKVHRVVKPVNDISYSQLLSKGNLIGSTSRVLIRKEMYIKAGGFDERLSCFQDYDLWIRMSKISEVVHDGGSEVIYTIHDNGSQISSRYNKYLDAGMYLCQKYKDDLEKLNVMDDFIADIYFRVSLSASSSCEREKIKYAFLSFKKKPSFKSLIFIFVPSFILRSIFKYV